MEKLPSLQSPTSNDVIKQILESGVASNRAKDTFHRWQERSEVQVQSGIVTEPQHLFELARIYRDSGQENESRTTYMRLLRIAINNGDKAMIANVEKESNVLEGRDVTHH